MIELLVVLLSTVGAFVAFVLVYALMGGFSG